MRKTAQTPHSLCHNCSHCSGAIIRADMELGLKNGRPQQSRTAAEKQFNTEHWTEQMEILGGVGLNRVNYFYFYLGLKSLFFFQQREDFFWSLLLKVTSVYLHKVQSCCVWSRKLELRSDNDIKSKLCSGCKLENQWDFLIFVVVTIIIIKLSYVSKFHLNEPSWSGTLIRVTF